jgi:hypothetical protein
MFHEEIQKIISLKQKQKMSPSGITHASLLMMGYNSTKEAINAACGDSISQVLVV